MIAVKRIDIVYQIESVNTIKSKSDNKNGERETTMKTKRSIQKTATAILIVGLFFLTGCGNDLPEDELVNNGQAFEIQKITDDIQASSFLFQNKEKFVTLTQLKDSVKELLGDQYWPEVSLTKEELERKTGITEDMYVDFLAEKQVLDSHIDTMIIIHAKEEHVGDVEQALEQYRTNIIEQNQNYPQNLCKAEASRMETINDYVCFVQLGADTTIVADKGEDEIISYCQEENERALYVLEKEILE